MFPIDWQENNSRLWLETLRDSDAHDWRILYIYKYKSGTIQSQDWHLHGYRRLQDKMQVTSLVLSAQKWHSDALGCDYNGNLLKTDTNLFEKQNIVNLRIYSARNICVKL